MGFRPRNTVMLKTFQNFLKLTNTVMLKKIKKIHNSSIYGQAGGRFLKILDLCCITVFRGFQGCEQLIFLSITVFCEGMATASMLPKCLAGLRRGHRLFDLARCLSYQNERCSSIAQNLVACPR